jgi:hypothetical protein|tara:strand:+ start:112 stop:315 length:204 start_codon:yes stop_codon:yes gene_type:complete
MIVTFDIADGSFDYYSKEAWKTQLTSWRVELEADGYEGSEALDAEEVVEMMYGEEMFFDEVGIEKIK